MIRLVFAVLLLPAFFGRITAQSTAYIFNAGPSVGFQKWDNGGDRQLLFKYHASIAVESVDNEDDRNSLFAQFGYHIKGSANRYRFLFQGGGIDAFTEEFRYNNLSLLLGAKQKFPLGATGRTRYFYFGGIRGDYTLSTNIDELAAQNVYAAAYYPQVGAMSRWMVGVSVGGGLQFEFSELVGAQVCLSINPDITSQINQPPGVVTDPFNPGQNITIGAKRVRNTTVELSLGLRLLKKGGSV
ncbi:MAG: hypothetical protein IPJ82_01720 [Lewinellaceae bacterium]|nr:hypothetical protein [Lewinellaceae bacterium]